MSKRICPNTRCQLLVSDTSVSRCPNCGAVLTGNSARVSSVPTEKAPATESSDTRPKPGLDPPARGQTTRSTSGPNPMPIVIGLALLIGLGILIFFTQQEMTRKAEAERKKAEMLAIAEEAKLTLLKLELEKAKQHANAEKSKLEQERAKLAQQEREASNADSRRKLGLRQKILDHRSRIQEINSEISTIVSDHPVLATSVAAAGYGISKLAEGKKLTDGEAAATLFGGIVALVNGEKILDQGKVIKNLGIEQKDLESKIKLLERELEN